MLGVVAACALSPRSLSPAVSGNEQVYMPLLMRQSDRSLLSHDWTIARLAPDRPLFNLLFRPLTATGSWSLVAWSGRFIGWTLLGVAVVCFLGGLGVRSAGVVTIIAVVWLTNRLSSVAGEWVAGTFEAKTFAYAALFAMLWALGDNRLVLAGLLGGVAFSLHNVVGFWTLVILGACVLALRPPRRVIGRLALATFVAAAPSMPAMIRYLGSGTDNSSADTRIVTRHAMSFHLDPAQFTRRGTALLAALFATGIVLRQIQARATPQRSQSWRVLAIAELVSAVVFAGGFVLRVLNLDSLLLSMPFRIGSVIIPVGALARLADVLGSAWRSEHRPLRAVASIGAPAAVLLLLAAGSAEDGLGVTARLTASRQHYDAVVDDTGRAFAWGRTHLPTDAVVAAPPNRKDAYSSLRRSSVASVFNIPLDALPQWRARMFDLSGLAMENLSGYELARRLGRGFSRQPFDVVTTWRERYHVTQVITTADYPLRVLFRSGDVRVYQVEPPGGS